MFNQAELYSKNLDLPMAEVNLSLTKYGNLVKFKPEDSILDIGIGDGRIMDEILIQKFFRGNYKEIVGIDLSDDMINYARKNENLKHVELETLDIMTENLPEKFKNRFDHVLSFNVFHWMTNLSQALKNSYNMLKPDGDVFLLFFAKTPVDDAFVKMSQNPKWKKYDNQKWCSTFYNQNGNIVEHYEKLMNEIGFTNTKGYIDLNSIEVDWKKQKNCYISVNPALRHVSEEDLEQYIEDFIKECFNQDSFEEFYKDGRKMAKVTAPIVTIYSPKK